MKNRYQFSLLVFALLLTNAPKIFAQLNIKSTITIESVVTDSEGNPIPKAELFSESSYAKTGMDGKFIISTNPDAFLRIEAKGYQSVTISADEARNINEISLQPSNFYYDDEQKINLGFRKVYEGDLIGAVTMRRFEQINDDKTVIQGINEIETLVGYNMLGLLGELSVRGLGHGLNVGSITSAGSFSARSMILVDGMPRALDYLRVSEIESITILKDANAAVMYGTSAINGVILVTTKRGSSVQNHVDFTARYGISTPKALPKYLNSADYLTYFNSAYLSDYNTPNALPYSEETINSFRNGNKYRYPDTDYFSSEYLNPFKSFFDVNGEMTGGNKKANYYANFSWLSRDDLFKIGYGKDARDNIYNIRVNTELKANDWISIETDGRVGLNIETMPIANVNNVLGDNYWAVASRVRPHEYAPLLPIEMINPDDPNLQGRKREIDGKYLLGWNGSRADANSLIGNMYAAGSLGRNSRIFAFSNRINVDLSALTPGLSFHTNVNFDFRNFWYQALLHQFRVYYPEWKDGEDIINKLSTFGEDAKQSTPSVTSVYLNRWFGGYTQLKYDRMFDDVHHLSGYLLGYTSIYKQSGNYQGDKRAHLGLQAAYIYDQRYMVDFSSVLVNSTKLPKGNRGGFSPTIGLAWVMSKENFMQDVNFLDYLKIRVSAGLMKTDIPFTDYFMYDSQYNTGGSLLWNDGIGGPRSGVVSTRGENPNLTYVDRKDLNFGLEAVFLDKSLRFETNLFLITNEGLPSINSSKYPSFYTSYLPIENYQNVKYQGFEVGLSYTRTMNDWTVFASINTLYSTSILTRTDEVWPYDYLKREGRSADACFGLETLGLFKDVDEIGNHSTQTFGSVRPGYIKYKDQNGDSQIDNDDQVYLGRWQSPLIAGLQLNLSYKNIALSVWGQARYGSVDFTESNYYWMSGNMKYSELAKNAWTESTWKNATYPRLTTGAGDNNFRRSTFWMYDNNYIQISRIQLTYRLPENASSAMRMKYSEVFGYITDPLLFSKNKDILELNTTGAPYFRSFVLGLKVSF